MTQKSILKYRTPEEWADAMIAKMSAAIEELPGVYKGSYWNWSFGHFMDMPWDIPTATRVWHGMWKHPEFAELNEELFRRAEVPSNDGLEFFHPRNDREIEIVAGTIEL